MSAARQVLTDRDELEKSLNIPALVAQVTREMQRALAA